MIFFKSTTLSASSQFYLFFSFLFLIFNIQNSFSITTGVAVDGYTESERNEKAESKSEYLKKRNALLTEKMKKKLIHVKINPLNEEKMGDYVEGIVVKLDIQKEQYSLIKHTKDINFNLFDPRGNKVGAEVVTWGSFRNSDGLWEDKVEIQEVVWSFYVSHNTKDFPGHLKTESFLNHNKVYLKGEFQDAYLGSYDLGKSLPMYVFRTSKNFIVLDVFTGSVMDEIPIQVEQEDIKNLTYQILANGSEVAIYRNNDDDVFVVNRVTDPSLEEPVYLSHRVAMTQATMRRDRGRNNHTFFR